MECAQPHSCVFRAEKYESARRAHMSAPEVFKECSQKAAAMRVLGSEGLEQEPQNRGGCRRTS
jgi:hypothetical protein